jgi:hypothetical protein
MPDWNGSYAQFRLNFEQQGKRAKQLLKAACLSLTEALALSLMAEPLPAWGGAMNLMKIYREVHWVTDPLPGQADGHFLRRVLGMEGAKARVYERRPGAGPDGEARPPWTDVLAITELGRAVLKGEVDFMSLGPPSRWVGGVQIGTGMPDWRWDEQAKDTVLCISN